jgi:TorA maturation chaperone TorD
MTPEETIKRSDHTNLLKGYNMLLYFAGSMIMYEPSEECVIDFLSDGILKRLPVSSDNPRFFKAAALLRETCSDREFCREMLIKDFNNLFSSDGLLLASPIKSAYKKKAVPEVSGGGVSEFYDSYGWKFKLREKVPDDHLGIELLFLTKMTDKYLQLDDIPCRTEMQKEIHRFIDSHILQWLPEWNDRVQDNALSIYYRGIGYLILACVEDLYEIYDYRSREL